MKHIMKLFCVLIIVVTISASFSTTLGSNTLEKNNNLMIETRYYDNNLMKKNYCELDETELDYLKECLINLNDAYITDDVASIQKYETILYEKGILNKKPNRFSFDDKFLKNNPILKHFTNQHPDENISNSFCYVNAAGDGLMIFTIGALLTIPTIILINIFGGQILSLLIPIYLVILILTHLIPFRIMLPIGLITMDSGKITTVGTSGTQNMDVEYPSAQLQLAGFTGVTINIPSNNTSGFLFVAGVSIIAKGYRS